MIEEINQNLSTVLYRRWLKEGSRKVEMEQSCYKPWLNCALEMTSLRWPLIHISRYLIRLWSQQCCSLLWQSISMFPDVCVALLGKSEHIKFLLTAALALAQQPKDAELASKPIFTFRGEAVKTDIASFGGSEAYFHGPYWGPTVSNLPRCGRPLHWDWYKTSGWGKRTRPPISKIRMNLYGLCTGKLIPKQALHNRVKPSPIAHSAYCKQHWTYGQFSAIFWLPNF